MDVIEEVEPFPSDGWLKRVCRIGQGYDCCRYLLGGAKGFECGKHTEFKALLDEKVAKGEMVACSDNCGGIKE